MRRGEILIFPMAVSPEMVISVSHCCDIRLRSRLYLLRNIWSMKVYIFIFSFLFYVYIYVIFFFVSRQSSCGRKIQECYIFFFFFFNSHFDSPGIDGNRLGVTPHVRTRSTRRSIYYFSIFSSYLCEINIGVEQGVIKKLNVCRCYLRQFFIFFEYFFIIPKTHRELS